MSNSHWLSILVPVYNAQAYIRECVESILSQADEGIELLLLDDASTDDSWKQLQVLQATHPGHIRLLQHTGNLGVSAARNHLLREARGDYLWFVDADDTMQVGAIAKLAGIIQSDAPDLVLCDFRTLRERVELKHRLRGELQRHTFAGPAYQRLSDRNALIRGLFECGQFHLWSKIGRSTIWKGLEFPDGRYYEDLSLAPVMALRAESYYYVPEAWIGYRQHGDSILATRTPQKIEDMMDALQWLPERLPAITPPLDTQARFAIAHYLARNYVSAARYMDSQGNAHALVRCHQRLLRIMPIAPQALLRAYLARGWLWRASRLNYWLRRAAKAST